MAGESTKSPCQSTEPRHCRLGFERKAGARIPFYGEFGKFYIVNGYDSTVAMHNSVDLSK